MRKRKIMMLVICVIIISLVCILAIVGDGGNATETDCETENLTNTLNRSIIEK